MTHRHATDRIDGTLAAECPNGCQSWEFVVETSKLSLDELVPDEFAECSACGAKMDMIGQERPTEVLE